MDGPRSDGRPPYTTPLSCLHALDAAQEYMRDHGSTIKRDELISLIEQAFHAGGRHDLLAGDEILQQVRAGSAKEATDAQRLTSRFDVASADCRN